MPPPNKPENRRQLAIYNRLPYRDLRRPFLINAHSSFGVRYSAVEFIAVSGGRSLINADKPYLWKEDIAASVDQYNDWFIRFAPQTYRETRAETVVIVEEAIRLTSDLLAITPETLLKHPGVLPTLRMSSAPPIARDRLVGLAYTTKSLVNRLEASNLPVRMNRSVLLEHLDRMCAVLGELLDRDLFPWVGEKRNADDAERYRASTVVADRLCGAMSDPIVRNAQEARQLKAIAAFLTGLGYVQKTHSSEHPIQRMEAGTFAFRMNVPVENDQGGTIQMPIDAVVQPRIPKADGFPLLIEAKSAGDFTNPNKRRKEEATKIRQLRSTYGEQIGLLLFLCGYFDAGYLGYEAAEGLDWVWEHRIEDMSEVGL